MKIVEENCNYKKLMYWLGGNYIAKRKCWEGTFFEQSHIAKRRNVLYRNCLLYEHGLVKDEDGSRYLYLNRKLK